MYDERQQRVIAHALQESERCPFPFFPRGKNGVWKDDWKPNQAHMTMYHTDERGVSLPTREQELCALYCISL
jgi:hypothetical protein